MKEEEKEMRVCARMFAMEKVNVICSHDCKTNSYIKIPQVSLTPWRNEQQCLVREKLEIFVLACSNPFIVTR